MMMIDIKTENGKMNIVNYIGQGFRGVRNDGRVFIGVIQDARPVKDRTLVIIRQADNTHKSFYMDDITGGWSASTINGQPFLLNR